MSRNRSKSAPPSVIESNPSPSSIELRRTRDILATDGFTAESSEYGRRANDAARIEDRIEETRNHVRDVERASAQAQRDYPNEVSYDEHVAGIDRSLDRGEYLAGWLIEHGWAPPSELAFVTSAESPASQAPMSADTSTGVPTCSLCRRERTLQDPNDYNPIQVVTGQPVGWYSGEDGEVCPQCMTKTLSGQL